MYKPAEQIYSIRMRASAQDRHVSGAERIVSESDLSTVVNELVSRARARARRPDSIMVTIERLDPGSIRHLTALDVVTMNAPDVPSCREAAARVLAEAGVSERAITSALESLVQGAAPSGGNMRGAMIMDAETGERLEPDRERGVRASRFDWSEEGGRRADDLLQKAGLTHFRTREALALATKAAYGPGVIAELCWSDEPDYTAGYVASLATGYVRFPFMKERGDEKGGRAFFVRRAGLDLTALARYLEEEPMLITDVGECTSVATVDEYVHNAAFCRSQCKM